MLTMADTTESYEDRLRTWLNALADSHGTTISGIARKAGLAESTLTRFMNREGRGNIPRERTLSKVETAFRSRRPSAADAAEGRGQVSAGRDYISLMRATVEDFLQKAEGRAGSNTENALVVRDEALNLAGYIPGDIVTVEPDAKYGAGDVVAVRFPGRSGEGLSLRIYDPPFLLTHSTDPTLRRPMHIDPDRVDIIGMAGFAMRPRKAG